MLYFGGRLYKYLIFKNLPKLLIKEMLEYSLPYTPDSLSWWLNNASNRFIISFFWDISQVGLFSAAARVPTIIITFQNIFYNAWQLSAINEYSSDNKDIFYSKIYSFYNFFILFISVIMIAFVKIIASLLLSDNFFSAWIFIPYLFVSVIFGALAGFLGTLFAASKQTNHLFASTLVGGSISIFLNIILIPIYGPIAASVTNLVGYFIVWILRLFFSRKFIKFKIDHKKNFFCYLLIFIQATFVIYFIDLVSYIISVITILIIILLNKHEFIVFMGSIIRFISKKKLLNYDPLSRFN
jgi:O-antigen/teichoic acid export membrane protein